MPEPGFGISVTFLLNSKCIYLTGQTVSVHAGQLGKVENVLGPQHGILRR
jgi:hypothetical protein